MPDSKIKIEDDRGDVMWVFLFPLFVWIFFFCRGCYENDASYFDEYMKGAHGHVVDGVKYESLKSEKE